MNRHSFLFQLRVESIPDSAAAEEASGAFANVWVLAATDSEGLAIAEAELSEAGWRVIEHEEAAKMVTLEDFAPGSVGRERFEQCELDGVVIELHTWRAEH